MKFLKEDIRWGIIGCGDVCEVKSGPAFSKIANSSLTAVMRRDLVKAQDYAMRHHVQKYYSNAQQLIDDPEVNAIYIATPPASHEEYAMKAMEAGKPVYIEKPIAMNAASCKRMLNASNQYQVPASGAYYRRALPLFKKVKSLLEEQKIGKIKAVIVSMLQSPTKNIITKTDDNWRVNPALSGGGLFHDLAPHQLDLMYWFFGKPTEVTGRSLNQDKNYEVPDLTTLDTLQDSVNLTIQEIEFENTPGTPAALQETGNATYIFSGSGLTAQLPVGFHLDPVIRQSISILVNMASPDRNTGIRSRRARCSGRAPCH